MNARQVQWTRLAADQYGLVSAGQLRQVGLSDGQRRHLLESGRLHWVRRSVYRVMGVPVSWEQSVLAAVLAAGPTAVVSHTTAGSLWQLRHCPPAPKGAGIHVSCARHVRIKGVRGHHRRLDGWLCRRYRGIPVTSPEQTIVDLAVGLNQQQLGECVDDAQRRGLISLSRLRLLVRMLAGPGRRRVVTVRAVLAERASGDDPGANDWERAMDRLWQALGLPEAVRQYEVRANGHRYRLDLALPELKIGVEWNGFATHGTRSGFDHDSDKRADLTAAGWHLLDFTTRSTPQRIRQAALAVITQRRAARERTGDPAP